MNQILTPFFEPRSVAIIGASAVPGKPGHEVIRNIQENGYRGKIYPVNPKGGRIREIDVFSSIASVPKDIDVAVIILPAAATAQAMALALRAGVALQMFRNVGYMVRMTVLKLPLPGVLVIEPPPQSVGSVPFGVAIALGSILSFVWAGTGLAG